MDTSTAIPFTGESEVISPVAYRFEFRGTAAEYFRIWLVNIALTILTLGIYSAWAKVRTKRYFYGNTFLGGENFEYHASPLSILIARLIIVAVVVGGGVWAQNLGTAEDLYYSIALFLLLPWAWVRGLSFNARNSSYRNIKFGFDRAYGFPYLFYTLNILLISIFVLPWLVRGYHKYKCAQHRWGELRFIFARPSASPHLAAADLPSFNDKFNKPSVWPYIVIFWLGPVILSIVSVIAAFIIVKIISPAGIDKVAEENLLYAVSVIFLLIIFIFKIQAHLFRLFWNGVRAENGAVFFCDFTAREFAYSILLVNFFATMFSFGLLHPWAKVRKTQFLTERIKIVAPPGTLDDIIARHREKEGALGEEFDASEGFDFDVGII